MVVKKSGNGILIMTFLVGLSAAQVASSADAPISGIVRSSDGKLQEGVAVSARADNRTFTTTVYTNHEGKYFFPPLDPGHYGMWAQAVGFDVERAELEIAADKGMQ